MLLYYTALMRSRPHYSSRTYSRANTWHTRGIMHLTLNPRVSSFSLHRVRPVYSDPRARAVPSPSAADPAAEAVIADLVQLPLSTPFRLLPSAVFWLLPSADPTAALAMAPLIAPHY